MALTVGSGPFGTKSKGEFNFDTSVLQAHTLYFEDFPRRVRAVFNGEVVADSEKVKMLHETGHLPLYYFPEEDVNRDLLEKTDHTTHCPFKGDAAYWSVEANGKPSRTRPSATRTLCRKRRRSKATCAFSGKGSRRRSVAGRRAYTVRGNEKARGFKPRALWCSEELF
ncbi:MAG TPA: DUF427 domain-containing protein [Rubrobacteraceae bacterium]|nr:DUF427 domain-containing protein [Rubrobacteraceae bacterium]